MSYVTRAKRARAAERVRPSGEPPFWFMLLMILGAVAPALMVLVAGELAKIDHALLMLVH